MHMRVGVNATFRKFLTYEVSTYNFHMSPKQVLQRAAEVGLGPKLEYDGLNTIKILNTEPGSSVKLFTSNVADTSNVFIVADPAAGEYTVPEAGKYYAEIKGTDTFTITKTIDVSGTLPLYQYPPLHTKYTWSNNTGDDTASDDTGTSNRKLFSVSGSGYGDGQYEAWQSVASSTSSGNPSKITGLFTNAVNIAYPTIGGQQLSNWFMTTTLSNVDLSLQLPSAKTIRKYIIYPLDTNAVSPYTPGSSVNPILEGNSNEDRLRLPKSWIFKGSNNLSGSWTTIHTVTNKVPSIYGDIHTISSPGSYIYYRISISANNGSSAALTLGELQLWGDA